MTVAERARRTKQSFFSKLESFTEEHTEFKGKEFRQLWTDDKKADFYKARSQFHDNWFISKDGIILIYKPPTKTNDGEIQVKHLSVGSNHNRPRYNYCRKGFRKNFDPATLVILAYGKENINATVAATALLKKDGLKAFTGDGRDKRKACNRVELHHTKGYDPTASMYDNINYSQLMTTAEHTQLMHRAKDPLDYLQATHNGTIDLSKGNKRIMPGNGKTGGCITDTGKRSFWDDYDKSTKEKSICKVTDVRTGEISFMSFDSHCRLFEREVIPEWDEDGNLLAITVENVKKPTVDC